MPNRATWVHERSCSVWDGIFDGLALRCATGCDRTTNAFESGFVVASHALRDAGQDAVCQPDVAGMCKSVRAPVRPDAASGASQFRGCPWCSSVRVDTPATCGQVAVRPSVQPVVCNWRPVRNMLSPATSPELTCAPPRRRAGSTNALANLRRAFARRRPSSSAARRQAAALRGNHRECVTSGRESVGAPRRAVQRARSSPSLSSTGH
jgi:hypothetical protein